VIGKDNKLVGFSGGLDVKEWLLEHEMFGVR
jgi:O6-methylguanine-DNA--protein-cysteine methyltransferase